MSTPLNPVMSNEQLKHLRTLQQDFARFDTARDTVHGKPLFGLAGGPDNKVSPSDLQAVVDSVGTDSGKAFSRADVEAARFLLAHPETTNHLDTAAGGWLHDKKISQEDVDSALHASEAAGAWKTAPVKAGPNQFELSIQGPDPDFAVGGTHEQQEFQRDVSARLAIDAAASYAGRGLPPSMRMSDETVSAKLDALNPNPPLGEDGKEVTHAVYRSRITGADPQQVFDHWVHDPNEVFNAGGMEIRPATKSLQNGGRYMLEIGKPPAWLPVQVHTDPEARSITIDTLDGHVLRGSQTFTFKDDGQGGTEIVQDARFQAGSELVGGAQQFLSISSGQHEAWQAAHRETYEQFNGDRGYAGLGIEFDPVGNAAAMGKEMLGNVRADPAGAVDAGIDLGGHLANLGADELGRMIGGSAEPVFDRLGDAAERELDGVGDFARALISGQFL